MSINYDKEAAADDPFIDIEKIGIDRKKITEEILNTEIEKLNFPRQIWARCRNSNIQYLKDFLEKTNQNMSIIRGLGSQSFTIIKKKTTDYLYKATGTYNTDNEKSLSEEKESEDFKASFINSDFENPDIVGYKNSKYEVFLKNIEKTPKIPEHKELHIVNNSGIKLAQIPYPKDFFEKLDSSEIFDEILKEIDKAELKFLKEENKIADEKDKQIEKLTEQVNSLQSAFTKSTTITVPQFDANGQPVMKLNGEIATAKLNCPKGINVALGKLARENVILRSENQQLRNQLNNQNINNDFSDDLTRE